MSKLKDIVKNVNGDVLGIGLEESLQDYFVKNKKITDYAFLNNLENSKAKKVKSSFGKTKTISIKKLRKKFKKNRVDYTICNINDVEKYLKFIVKDTIYFTKTEIYLYFFTNEELCHKLESMYHRYQVEITKSEGEKYTYLQIKNKDKKKNKLKDLYFLWKDTLQNGMEYLRNFLSY